MRGGQGEGYWAAPGYKGGTRKPTTAQALSGSRALISVSSGGFGRLRGAPGFRDRLIGRPVCASASKRSRPSLPLKKTITCCFVLLYVQMLGEVGAVDIYLLDLGHDGQCTAHYSPA